MPAKDSPIQSNITTFAWNGDYSQIAIANSTNEVLIYDTSDIQNPQNWVQLHTLQEHDGFVSGIDWCGSTNTIVTCGHDRNAYVWEYDEKDNSWSMDLVILRIAFAATSITWSPDGKKFGVTSGAKCVSVCSWSPKHNFWASSIIKKGFKSTVLCLAWCVNNKFIVTGSTDFKTRIHSAYMPEIDSDEDDGFGAIWPKQHTFGALLASFDLARSWINSVAWSPSGMRIAFVGQAANVHFVQIGAETTTQSINTKFLPFADISFLDDDNVVCVGYDMNPAIFHNNGSDPADPQFAFAANVDPEEKKEKKSKKSNTRAARSMFKDMSSRGTKKKSSSQAYLTRHQNCITKVHAMEPTAFCTSGLDGRFLFWDLNEVPDLASVVSSMSS